MIGDGVAGLALWLMRGPIVLLGWLFTLSVAALAGVGWGRWSALRQVDEGRAVVLAAVEDAAAPTVAGRLPVQRDGGER